MNYWLESDIRRLLESLLQTPDYIDYILQTPDCIFEQKSLIDYMLGHVSHEKLITQKNSSVSYFPLIGYRDSFRTYKISNQLEKFVCDRL